MSKMHDEVVVLGGGLSKFARERADGTPVEWMVEGKRRA